MVAVFQYGSLSKSIKKKKSSDKEMESNWAFFFSSSAKRISLILLLLTTIEVISFCYQNSCMCVSVSVEGGGGGGSRKVGADGKIFHFKRYELLPICRPSIYNRFKQTVVYGGIKTFGNCKPVGFVNLVKMKLIKM